MARRSIIAGNWKMNKTIAEAKDLVKDIIEELGIFDDVEVVICPPFTSLPACQQALEGTSTIFLGAQNMHEEMSGAFTGEISAGMLRELYCRFVILGHSERRQYFGESDDLVNTKTKAALAASLQPIVCVGETLEERESDKTSDVIKTQVTTSLAGLTEDQWDETIIAYEPVWAIGTGKVATPDQAQDVHALIRSLVSEMTSPEVAEKVRIQYGGSVKPNNAKDLLGQPDIDGALVGGASLDGRSFVEIIKSAVA